MKRMNFLTAALGVAIVAAIALTGCDEVLNEPKKGTETEVTGYGIISLDQSDVFFIFTFDPQGGDMGNVPKGPVGQVKIYVQPGEKATKPSPDPTKGGYTFGGWYTDTACTKLYDFDTPVKANFTVYAKWVPISCKVTYSLNGAPGTPPYDHGYITCGQTLTEPAAPQWTGHTFVGWYLNADGTGTAWNFKTDTITENITLYAKWTLGVYAISFAAAITDMANHATAEEMTYELTAEEETYTVNPTLTSANCPAKVTINGGGRFVTGNGNRITIGSGVTLTLTNITFTEIPFTVAAGGTLILGSEGAAADSTVIQGNAATGVTVSGTLEMKDGALVTENGSSDVVGSGVRLEGIGSRFTMNGGTISNNSSINGGGVALTGTGGLFTMNDGTISDNSVTDIGGGVAVWGTDNEFIMTGDTSTISGNSTDNYGGGVDIGGSGAKFDMSGGAISENTAFQNGGGVTLSGTNSEFTMSGGKISGNITCGTEGFATAGGVVAYGSGAVFTMENGEIYGNKSKTAGGGLYIHSAHFTMKGGKIYNNETNIVDWGNNSQRNEYGGGGVYIYLSVFDMEGGKIYSNTANKGGGVMVYNSTFNMIGGEIYDNNAYGGYGGGVYLFVNGTLTGNPSIGSKDSSKGSIYDNTPNDVGN